MDIHSICRICLEYLQNGSAYDLFLVPGLAKKLCMCTSLSVEPQDVFPNNICGVCYTRLSDMADFQKLCADSVQKFQELLANNKITCQPTFDIMGAPATAPIEGIQMPEDVNLNFDPLLTNHKMEMLENEDDVFKMLETVDKEEVEEVPPKIEEEFLSDESSEEDKESDDDFQFPDANDDDDDDSDSDDDKLLATRLRNIKKELKEESENTETDNKDPKHKSPQKPSRDEKPTHSRIKYSQSSKYNSCTKTDNSRRRENSKPRTSPSSTKKKKPTEKLPYYRDEQLERDRLKRLYGRPRSRTPTTTSTGRRSPSDRRRVNSPTKRRRSVSRDRHRRHSPFK